jgi:hypothetical protein
MERWLILSHCQTRGLAQSFTLLSSSLQVEAADVYEIKSDAAAYIERMSDFTRLVVHPDIETMLEFDLSGAANVSYLPPIEFGAYHPDMGYYRANDELIYGPLGLNQSSIALAAWHEGVSPADTRALFNGYVYERCGFYEDWVPQRDLMLETFRSHGVELDGAFQRWGRKRAFMYSMRHPRIEVLHDVARQFLASLGMETKSTDLRPADLLVNGSCPPVYDEIADVLGVPGSYLFKKRYEYRYLDLDEFICASFELFARYPRGSITPHRNFEARYDRTLRVVRGEA